MSKLIYVLQKHTTFTQKDKIAFVVCHLNTDPKETTYSIMYGSHVYGLKGNQNYLKNRPDGKHLLYIPFYIDDEIVIPKKGTNISSLESLRPYLPLANSVNTFNQLLTRAYGSKSNLIKKQLDDVKEKHAFLGFRNEEKIHLRTHFDMRIQVGDVLKSFVSNSEKLPNEFKKKMFVIESQDHPLTWKDFEGVLPYGYGMGYTQIIDTAPVELIKSTFKSIKFNVKGEYLNGLYSLVKINKKVWVFTKMEEPKEIAKDNNLFKTNMSRIARPSYLKVNYKYNTTMAPVFKSITYLQDVIDNKHFDALYEGKEELLISPTYTYKDMKGCMVMLDFDSNGALSGVNKFLSDISQFGLTKYFFVVKSGGGYHVCSFFGINNYDIEDLKKFKVWKRYNSLDANSSFRDVPIRVPFTYNFKRKSTNIAVLAKDIDKLTGKVSAIMKNTPSAIMPKNVFKKNINYYLYAHDFLLQKRKPVSTFFEFLSSF